VFKALLNVKTNHNYELTHDLLANSGRRAQQGKYDDAVARIYRALEALAQTRLKKEYEIDTANVASATIQAYAKHQIPAKFTGRDTFELGMISAYELLELFDDAVGKTWTAYSARIRDNIQFRNNSILAHGFTPVTVGQYTGFRQLVDAFVGDIRKNNIKIGDALPQFPTLADLLALQG
jgi:CRISPR-associated protein (TIGR02710 family)